MKVTGADVQMTDDEKALFRTVKAIFGRVPLDWTSQKAIVDRTSDLWNWVELLENVGITKIEPCLHSLYRRLSGGYGTGGRTDLPPFNLVRECVERRRRERLRAERHPRTCNRDDMPHVEIEPEFAQELRQKLRPGSPLLRELAKQESYHAETGGKLRF